MAVKIIDKTKINHDKADVVLKRLQNEIDNLRKLANQKNKIINIVQFVKFE